MWITMTKSNKNSYNSVSLSLLIQVWVKLGDFKNILWDTLLASSHVHNKLKKSLVMWFFLYLF